jgi:TPR repeat protein
VYYNGQGVPQDHAAAAHWYRKAAEQCDAVAQQGLAYMYYNGVGVPQDYSEAVLWYRKAAEQREVVAQEFLGYMYATGRGVPIDRSQAIAWYHKAANQDDAKAKHALESLEPSGLMGRRNFELISAWIGFPVGLWLCLDFVLRGRKLRDRRQGAIAILGVVFLSNAGLSLYASHDSMSYWLHKDVFDIARWFLNTAAILIIVTVVLRAKKS